MQYYKRIINDLKWHDLGVTRHLTTNQKPKQKNYFESYPPIHQSVVRLQDRSARNLISLARKNFKVWIELLMQKRQQQNAK